MKTLRKQEIKKKFKTVKREKEIYLILENIQYARNVAGIFRTADAAGVRRIYLTGISKIPPFGKDLQKASRHKENSVEWMYREKTLTLLEELKNKGFEVIAIELTDEGMSLEELPEYVSNHDKICFVAGSEVYGVTKETLARCHTSVYIPMYGKGASLNVGTSVGITLYSF